MAHGTSTDGHDRQRSSRACFPTFTEPLPCPASKGGGRGSQLFPYVPYFHLYLGRRDNLTPGPWPGHHREPAGPTAVSLYGESPH